MGCMSESLYGRGRKWHSVSKGTLLLQISWTHPATHQRTTYSAATFWVCHTSSAFDVAILRLATPLRHTTPSLDALGALKAEPSTVLMSCCPSQAQTEAVCKVASTPQHSLSTTSALKMQTSKLGQKLQIMADASQQATQSGEPQPPPMYACNSMAKPVGDI
jgi:hypothetical protein